MSPPSEKSYVLGTHDEELGRLGFQHRLWSDVAVAQWKRAGFNRGQTILDVGSGPGFASRDLAQLVGPTGCILALDESARYIEFVNHLGSPTGGAPIDARVGDVQSLDVSTASADGAYIRWVLSFTPEPLRVIQGVSRALKTGACVAVQDYSNWYGLHWGPKCESLPIVQRAILSAYTGVRADSTIGRRIPSMMEECGLKVVDVRALARTAQPHEALWQWPTTFFSIFLPKVVEMGHMTQDEFNKWRREWTELEKTPGAMFFTPPQVEIIAQKR